MTSPLVNVALPLPLTQLFTYTVPNFLKDIIQQGSVVTVPFGKKILTGVVIEFTQARPSVTLKSIIDILPSSIQLSDEQLNTARWISEYYNAPIGEATKLFLPVGISNISESLISLATSNFSTVLPQQSKDELSRIITILSKEPLTIRQIQKATGIQSVHAIVNKLVKEGVLTIEERPATRPSIKKELFLRRVHNSSDLTIKHKRQKEIFETLLQLNVDEISVKEFLKSTSFSLSSLKSLASKGIVELYYKEVERKHHFEPDDQALRSLSLQLNASQQQAVDSVVRSLTLSSHNTFLLHGVTGSGKTQVYIESIRKALELGKSCIVLVPEISLTPQTVRRFQAHFGESVIWMHSKLSTGERYDAWRLTKEGKYRIVIGPRSAVFAPVKNLGLIVVDEEHEASYKQFDAIPRYHARDVAIVRGMVNNATVLLGSATPSIESYANSVEGKYTLLTLPERADNAQLPPIEIVDMVEERKRRYNQMKLRAKEIGKKAFENAAKSISLFLETKIRDRLEKKEGIILLQNRRGFAPFIECDSCGHVEQCERCNVTLTYHATKKHLRCHYCGKVKPAPTTCPQCNGFEFSMRGFGTQRVEEELTTLFPSARILRMDLDTTSRKHSHEKILQQFGNGDADILLGTQMVAKGLDFPRVTLVGVISADTQMMLPDFRSAERTFQLLTQVAGRAGRSLLKGEVVIQTSQPSHYALKHVQDHDYVGFYTEELTFRKQIGYPPFSRIVVVELKGRNEKNVELIAQQFGASLSKHLPSTEVLGPSPAVLSKIKNEYRWHILVKADKAKDKNGTRARSAVARVAEEMQKESVSKKVKIIVDVDPVGIL